MQINLRKIINIIILAAVFILLVLAVSGAKLYTDWLWFQALSYQQVFTTIIVTDIGLRLAVGVVLFIFLFINLLITRGPLLKATQRSTVIKEDEVPTIHLLL